MNLRVIAMGLATLMGCTKTATTVKRGDFVAQREITSERASGAVQPTGPTDGKSGPATADDKQGRETPKQVQTADGTTLDVYSDHVATHDSAPGQGVIVTPRTNMDGAAALTSGPAAAGSSLIEASSAAAGAAPQTTVGGEAASAPPPASASVPVAASSGPITNGDESTAVIVATNSVSDSVDTKAGDKNLTGVSTAADITASGTNGTVIGINQIDTVSLVPNTVYDLTTVSTVSTGSGDVTGQTTITTLAAVPLIEMIEKRPDGSLILIIDAQGNPTATQYNIAVQLSTGGEAVALVDAATGTVGMPYAEHWAFLPEAASDGMVELTVVGLKEKPEAVTFTVQARNRAGDVTAWSPASIAPLGKGPSLTSDSDGSKPSSVVDPPSSVVVDAGDAAEILRSEVAALRAQLENLHATIAAARKSRKATVHDQQEALSLLKHLEAKGSAQAIETAKANLAKTDIAVQALASSLASMKADVRQSEIALKETLAKLKALKPQTEVSAKDKAGVHKQLKENKSEAKDHRQEEAKKAVSDLAEKTDGVRPKIEADGESHVAKKDEPQILPAKTEDEEETKSKVVQADSSAAKSQASAESNSSNSVKDKK